jgi:hypothetical protein
MIHSIEDFYPSSYSSLMWEHHDHPGDYLAKLAMVHDNVATTIISAVGYK